METEDAGLASRCDLEPYQHAEIARFEIGTHTAVRQARAERRGRRLRLHTACR
jgi:hypothetical protein